MGIYPLPGGIIQDLGQGLFLGSPGPGIHGDEFSILQVPGICPILGAMFFLFREMGAFFIAIFRGNLRLVKY